MQLRCCESECGGQGRAEGGFAGLVAVVEAPAVVEPRYAWAPPCVRSLGADCIEFWRSNGGELFGWQELVIEGLLGIGEDGLWASTTDGLCVARQNGKGIVLQAIEVFVAFELGHSLGYDLVTHTAHEFATSQEHQMRLDDFIQNAPALHRMVKERGGYKHANGQESINLKDGTRIIFKARTKGGGRGYSGDLLVWDEAMHVPDSVIGAQKPMLRASTAAHGAKTIYSGSAVDEDVHEYGVNFARTRERGIARQPKVAYFEWSAPFDHPDEMTEGLLRDRSLFALGNPSMPEGLIAEETMADEVESMPARTAAVELHDVGAWPRTSGAETVFPLDHWRGLSDPESRILGQLVLSFDVSPARTRSSIGVSGPRRDGLAHIEVIDARDGTGWVAGRLAELVAKHRAREIVFDELSQAKSLLPELAALGLKARGINTSEYVAACGGFFDAVQQRKLRQRSEEALEAVLESAVKGASQREVGERWAWSRRRSSADITSLVAVTLAWWVAATKPVHRTVGFS